jgi:predicted RNase H-like nuclease (RuvC/YqgF family)
MSLTLTACATREQQAKTESTVTGAVIGGAGAGVATYAITRKPSHAVAATVIGAVLGGMVGYTYADRMSKYRQQLVERKGDLAAQIELAEHANWFAQKRIVDLESAIEALQPEIDNLVRRWNAGKMTQRDLEAERTALAYYIKAARRDVAEAEKDLSDLKALGETSKELDAEIDRLTRHLGRLRTLTKEMVAQRQRIPLSG